MTRVIWLLVLASCVNVPPFAGGDASVTDDGAAVDAPGDRITVHVHDRDLGAPIEGATVHIGDTIAHTNALGLAEASATEPVDVVVIVDTTSAFDVVTIAGAMNGDELFIGEPDVQRAALAPLHISLPTLVTPSYFQAFNLCSSANGTTSPLSLPRDARCSDAPRNHVLLVHKQGNSGNDVAHFKNVQVASTTEELQDIDANYQAGVRRTLFAPNPGNGMTVGAELRALANGEVIATEQREFPMGASSMSFLTALGPDPQLEYALNVRFGGNTSGYTLLQRLPATTQDCAFDYGQAPPRPTSISVAGSSLATGVAWTTATGPSLPATMAVLTAYEVRGTKPYRWRWIVPAPADSQFALPAGPSPAQPSTMGRWDVELLRIDAPYARAKTIADRAMTHATRFFSLPGTSDVAIAQGTKPPS